MPPRFQYTESPSRDRNDWQNLKALTPYMWEYKGRVLFALACLITAKLANVGVPLILKELVDKLSSEQLMIAMPVALLGAYGLLRMASSMFNELRDVVFTRVRYRAMRRLTIRTLEHLHNLALRFHLERKTGAISRDLQRGAASLSSLLNYLTFSLLPVMVEFLLVAGYMLINYDPVFTLVIVLSIAVYVAFTFAVINWRMEYRVRTNQFESDANNQAVDSLINYETVKYFGNERLEINRCDSTLEKWEDNAVLAQSSMSLLNFGQAAIISVGVTAMMYFAAAEVIDKQMTIGDFVLVNAFLLQLFMPLGFLGMVYRQIKYTLADMEQLVRLLREEPEIRDKPGAKALQVTQGDVRFEHVDFNYRPERQTLFDVSFHIPPGKKVAVVGPSGAGKSTLARLLYRFYEVTGGSILIDGQDIRDVSQESVRQAIGIVPQDTVLFNESIYYNLAYANLNATREQIIDAAKMAHIHDFIESLPEKYETIVGERGLKLSGGEKQRVAIARAILKQPRIMIFDEATSALDSQSEQSILQALRDAAANHSTLVIAHRLSTIVDADNIVVLRHGRIVESGTHQALLEAQGDYAKLWEMQQQEQQED